LETHKLIKELEGIVGRSSVIHHPDDLLVFAYDGLVDTGTPQAVVFPTATEQVSQVLALANTRNIPVIPRGAGTGLSGGAIAHSGGIELSLTRMSSILEIDPANRTALVEPGVVNLDLSTAASIHGLYFAPDPSSQRACTIGGNVAENSGGPHCLKYGVTTNHVLALEVVLEDGSILWVGDAYRGRPGYDLVGALVGSEGMLGVFTKAIVSLLPSPESVRTLLAVFSDIDLASNAVSKVIASGLIPTAMEMMDSLTIRAVEKAMNFGYPNNAGAILLIEIDGLEVEVVNAMEQVIEMCYESGATDVKHASEAKDRERLWAGRKGALGALGALAPNYYLVDGVVPRSKLTEVLQKVGEIGEKYGLPIANVLHAGDGNLHPLIIFDERQEGKKEQAMEAGGKIVEVCVNAGGTLTGEHGVGLEKKDFMPLVFNDEDLASMMKLKDTFAPGGLLNPGKMFPDGSSCADFAQINLMGSASLGFWI
tara:strand:- start:149 stop:1591 length:1443 start_codon:yes stop_codon:yes gene_type:complete